MARPKIARKSTIVDMTAMCDVAFLLLSFFILTTKFKPSEAVQVETPTSVASKVAPEKDIVLISITSDGKVFLNMDDVERKKSAVSELNKNRNLGLSEAEINTAANTPFFGTPIAQLRSSLSIPKEKYLGTSFPGIPAKDSVNNEMMDWMSAVTKAYQGAKMNLLLKGDMNSKYPTLKNVIAAFKRYDQLKFQMVTNQEGVPEGTELFRTGKRTSD
jgi:biopolymer transport protein ExbD